MNINQLRPAGTLAARYGVKSMIYGNPGTGKTPLINTAPRPVLLVCEPGMLSMRGSTVPAWEAKTPDQIAEFFRWFFESPEARNFDTIGIDSVSQMAEIYLTDELKKNKDGRKAYGEMSTKVMEHVTGVYYLLEKHVYLICKQQIDDENGIKFKRPFFPGKDLNVKIPHLFDEIWHLQKTQVPGIIEKVSAIHTKEGFDFIARDRTGLLGAIEQPNLTQIFNKCMGI